MENEKRLIDADYLVTMIARNAKLSVTAFSEISRIIRNIETVDAVEVVRCKDCKCAYINSFSARSGVAVCRKWSNEAEIALVKQDDFCSYGERKDNG